MDLRHQLALLRVRYRFVLAGALLAALAALGASVLLPPTYEARTTLVVGQSLSAANPDYNQLLASQRLSQTYAEVAITRPILASAISQLGLDTTPDELADRVSAQAPTDSTLVVISAQDRDPATAAAIANAVAGALLSATTALQGQQSDVRQFISQELVATQQQIEETQRRIAALSLEPAPTPTNPQASQSPDPDADPAPTREEELRELLSQQASLRTTYVALLAFASSSSASLLTVIDPAVPADPASPLRVLLIVLLAGLIGALIAIIIANIGHAFRSSFDSPADVSSALGLPALGVVPRLEHRQGTATRPDFLTSPTSASAEAFRALRASILSLDAPAGMLVVTSALPGEGKTTVASNLAAAFALAGNRTMLVDANLREPGLHQAFNLPNDLGFATILLDYAAELEAVSHEVPGTTLRVLTSGPLTFNPGELLASERTKAVLQRIREANDVVVIDSPALQTVTDGATLAGLADGTLLVVDVTRARRSAVQQGCELLARVRARILGVVVNRVERQAAAVSAVRYDAGAAPGDTSTRS